MCAGVRRLLDEGINLVGKVAVLSPANIEAVLIERLTRLVEERKAR